MAIMQSMLYIQSSHKDKLCLMSRSVLAGSLPELSRMSTVPRTSLYVWGVSQKFRDWGNTKISGLRYSNVGIVPFRIVPFALYTRHRAPLPLPEAPQNLLFGDAVQHLLRFSFNSRDALESSSLRCTLICGEIKISQRARSWKWRGGRPPSCLFRLQIP